MKNKKTEESMIIGKNLQYANDEWRTMVKKNYQIATTQNSQYSIKLALNYNQQTLKNCTKRLSPHHYLIANIHNSYD